MNNDLDFLNIKKCSVCQNLYLPKDASSFRRICPKCREKEEEDFLLVKDFLRKKESAGITDIYLETGVEEKKIIEFLKEGRLETTTLNYLLNCEKCNKPIKSGRYCNECISVLNKNISSICNLKNDEKSVEAILTKIQLRRNK